ncbi:MAG: excinuclease ABC subunit UvrC [Dehalococcoidia bacterium]|nr:excinuclease ABC subunit UvrC [Dehalococcoidia bacterium]MDW8120364.1 excinuclease ABC subunit UvrC [Chloroflexota bacterium]
METPTPALQERLKALPDRPGVYMFLDARGQVLYVGKAARLRDRGRAYCADSADHPPKIRRMLARAADLEVILTHSESEALLLENTLIKRHRPPYNTRLRDDKTYPYIRIDLQEDFPLVYFTRKVHADGALYFGPYASAGSVRRTLDLLKRLFPYRSCTKTITGTDPRPCLEYFIHRCAAPCTGYISREGYREIIQQVIQFLQGKAEEVLRRLHQQMREAAERWDFERAAGLRDQIRAIQQVLEEQKVVSLKREDMDIIALAHEHAQARAEVFFIRQGKLVERDHFSLEGTQDEPPAQVLAHFLLQFYQAATFIPPLVVVPCLPQDANLIAQTLTAKRGAPVRLMVPKRGAKKRLLDMATENAQEGLRLQQARALADQDALQKALAEVQEALNLPRLPVRIECYDISNIRGTDAVGSMVVFVHGKPHRAHYRRFKVRTVQGIDDYAMLREVLRRRFTRLAEAYRKAPHLFAPGNTPPDQEAWGIVPDLVVVDGGKGHLSVAQEVFLALGLSTDFIPLAALAKEREELFVPHAPEPILLPRGSQGLFLVQRLRDEAHRFAVSYHQRLRSKRQTSSVLDTVPGIGPKRKRLLLRTFGSLKAIKDAPVERIAALPGMTWALAQRLKESL